VLRGTHRLGTLAWLLVGVDFLDELASGVPGLGTPGIQSDLRVSYGMAAGWLQAALLLAVLALEPPLLLLADRYPRRRFVVGGLVALALLTAAAGLAPGFWFLFAALVLWGPTAGVCTSVAQATLMDANPDGRERWMTRWTLSGSLGDLATPLLFAALAGIGLGWRVAFVASAAMLGIYTLVLGLRSFPDDARVRVADLEPLLESLRLALVNRRLLLWAVGVSLTTLLDEALVAFGALHLRDHLGADTTARSAIFACFVLGGVVGLAASEALLRRVEPLTLLIATTLGAALVFPVWMLASSVIASSLWIAVLGALVATHYPLAKAQAYRALPERSGAVNAVASLLSILDVSALFAVALVADRFGLLPALALLGLGPVGLLGIALVGRALARRNG
jgi:MFS family permease